MMRFWNAGAWGWWGFGTLECGDDGLWTLACGRDWKSDHLL